MNSLHRLKVASYLCVALGGLTTSGLASAIPSVTLNPSLTQATQGSTASVTITAVIGDAPNAENTIVFHDIFLAYDPAVLVLTNFTWGADTLKVAGNITTQFSGGEESYADPTYGFTNPLGWSLGTVASTTSSVTGVTDPFYAGSLRLWQNASATAQGIIDANGVQTGKSLFTATFDIVTTNIAMSSIVLIDKRYFDTDGESFDWKTGADAVTNVTVNPAEAEVVPVPGVLALFGAGLLGLVGIRRRLAR